MRLGVDIGGTYTDVVLQDVRSGEVRTAKVLSVPQTLEDGVRQATALVAPTLSEVTTILHGSTVAINALVERRGARTALVTTAGFRDVYEIGRINRPDSFNPRFRKHRPLVARVDIFEVNERRLFDGTVRCPLDEAEARSLAIRLHEMDYESVAVVFLHAYRFPQHEIKMATVLREVAPAVFVTCSHELTREYREYERTSTTVANAFVGPKVTGYLSRLENDLRSSGFGGDLLLLQSNGGLCEVATARHQPILTLESGPAAGVVGAQALCELLDIDSAVCLDMGGTTSKASVVTNKEPNSSVDYYLGGYNEGLVIRIPSLEIVEVGTGGGSVAWLGEAGELHVGPRSAGAHPGPASFGLGGMEPTVTDANVALGWLRPGRLLSGQVRLSASAAEAALEGNLAGRLGISVAHAASGILEVATAQIANAARQVTLQRGLDPRGVTLIAYGGAGPLHAAAVARELGITRVVIPRVPGNFSAFGMLMADLRQEIVQTVFMRLTEVDLDELEVEFRKLESEAISSLGRSTQDAQAVWVERAADMRYVGQEHAVTVRLPSAINNEITARADIKARFDAAHARRYSHAAEHEAADLVSLRVAVVGRLTRPRLPELPRDRAFAGWTSSAESQRASRIGEARAGVVGRDSLRSGSRVSGPVVIEEEGSTTRVDEGDRVAVDQYGHLIIEVSHA